MFNYHKAVFDAAERQKQLLKEAEVNHLIAGEPVRRDSAWLLFLANTGDMLIAIGTKLKVRAGADIHALPLSSSEPLSY